MAVRKKTFTTMNNRSIIKNRCSGYASNEGNGMVGGAWAGATALAHKDFYLSDFTDDIEDEARGNNAYIWLKERLDDPILLEAYFDVGYDHSVGLGEYCDLNETFIPDGFEEDVNECPFLTESEKEALVKMVQGVAEKEDGYEFYEIEDPEPNDD